MIINFSQNAEKVSVPEKEYWAEMGEKIKDQKMAQNGIDDAKYFAELDLI